MSWKSTVRLVRELTGERAYEIYLEHRARRHPGEPVLPEREFWRDRTDERDRNPRITCC
ncbi:MAG: YbdD/YjiX family protein [Streptosporangiaceae bacterium]